MNKKLTTKEIVVVAMVAAVVGVIYTLLDYAYMPMTAVLGTVFMELTFGIYMLSGALPMHPSQGNLSRCGIFSAAMIFSHSTSF